MLQSQSHRTLAPRFPSGRTTIVSLSIPRQRPFVFSPLRYRVACQKGIETEPLVNREEVVKDASLRLTEAQQLFGSGQKKEGLRQIRQATALYPDNIFLCTTAGVMEGKMGNTEEARKLFQHVLDLKPDDIPALSAWGVMEESVGQKTRAEELFRMALDLDPLHAPNVQALALLCIKTRRLDEARELLKNALREAPKDPSLLFAMATLELTDRKPEAAEKTLMRILAVDRFNMEAITTIGKLYWRQNKYREARIVFSSITKESSTRVTADVLNFWAGLEMRIGNRSFASMKLQEVLKIDPFHLSALVTLAVFEARSGHIEEARSLYDRAMAVDDTNAHLQNSVAQFLKQQGKTEEAKEHLRRFVDRVPSCGVSWHILGDLLMEEGSWDQARECYERGIKTRQTKGVLLCLEGLAELHVFLGEIIGARDLYEMGEEHYKPTARYYRMWANFEKNQSNYEVARQLFKKSHARNPQDNRTLLRWGLLARRSGNLKEAEECFLKGLESHKTDASIWYSYATTLAYAGFINKARSVFDDALNALPKDGPLLMESALLEWKQGNIDVARARFRNGAQPVEGSVHRPLLEAWLQMEKSLENEKEVERIEKRLQSVYNPPRATQRSPKSSTPADPQEKKE